MSIQIWHKGENFVMPDGDYVKFEDHAAEVEKLKAKHSDSVTEVQKHYEKKLAVAVEALEKIAKNSDPKSMDNKWSKEALEKIERAG